MSRIGETFLVVKSAKVDNMECLPLAVWVVIVSSKMDLKTTYFDLATTSRVMIRREREQVLTPRLKLFFVVEEVIHFQRDNDVAAEIDRPRIPHA